MNLVERNFGRFIWSLHRFIGSIGSMARGIVSPRAVLHRRMRSGEFAPRDGLSRADAELPPPWRGTPPPAYHFQTRYLPTPLHYLATEPVALSPHRTHSPQYSIYVLHYTVYKSTSTSTIPLAV